MDLFHSAECEDCGDEFVCDCGYEEDRHMCEDCADAMDFRHDTGDYSCYAR